MRTSPVLFSFQVTFVIWLAAFLYLYQTTGNPETFTFTAAFMFLIFPFAWFVVWLIVNAVVWWKEVTGRSQEGDTTPQDSGETDARPKKRHRLRGS